MTKFYVTKYALTEGIKEVEAVWKESSPGMIFWRQKEGGLNNYAHGDDWHPDLDSAVKRAELMRTRKIESLKKSIKKMESLKFD